MKQDKPFGGALTDEGRYRLLIEAVADYAIYMLDPEGIVSSWNPGARRFKGYEASEILGQHFSRFYVEEDRLAGMPEHALEIARTDGRFETEAWRVRKDGGRFWAHVVIDPIWAPSGELLGYAKITRDLTERRAREDALRQSEEQFKRLVQGVTDYAVYMLDPKGRVISWNLGAQRIKGYAADEIIGEHFSRFYTPEDREAGEPGRALRTAAREGRFEKEGWRVRKDGGRFWASVVIDPIRDEAGKILGYAKITRDITERMETQRELEHAREALFQSQKMDAIGQLTGGIAHDFNNLLMAILGSLELARKRLPDDAKLAALVDNAIQGAQRGAALTQRMLAFARRQELKSEPVDVGALVGGLTDLLQSSVGPLVKIRNHIPLGIDPIQADANQLEMALLNLVVNSRDAMPDGGEIRLEAREETIGAGAAHGLAPGRYVCLSVADTGEGMDEETLARATEPFFTTKGSGKGTEFGLSMIHGIAEQLGGRLVLKSRKGEGVTAELWLPVAQSPADPNRHTEQAELPAQTRELVVLTVDDDNLVLVNTAAMLEDMGHTVFAASSGAQALEILRHEPNVDLVIADQAMPHMTGSQLAEAVHTEWPDLPIILATGYAETPPGANLDLLKLAKPFRQDDLARVVAEVVIADRPADERPTGTP